MNSYREIREGIYSNVRQRRPYMFEQWRWYYYRRFKATLYIEGASLLAFLFLKLGIAANSVTLFYVLAGILAGILLALPCQGCIIAAIALFYFRGVLDWTDGVIARLNKQVSITGGALDSYGALAGWVALWTGMGFYLGNHTNQVFYYLTPVIPAIFAADIHINFRETFIYHYLIKKEYRRLDAAALSASEKALAAKRGFFNVRRMKDAIDRVFEHNARTVDLICLLILLELIFSVSILWVFYLAFLFWQVLIFILRIYLFSRTSLPEKEFSRLKQALYGE